MPPNSHHIPASEAAHTYTHTHGELMTSMTLNAAQLTSYPCICSCTHIHTHTHTHGHNCMSVIYTHHYALLYGVADGVLRRLQSVLHAAARLITGIRHFDHITPTLRDTLHWLPISQRITFKIALMVFDCSRGRCPKYFSDVYIPVHTVMHVCV